MGLLLLFGVGLTLGNVLGGRLADWRLMPFVPGLLAGLVPVLSLFAITSVSVPATAATLFVWGVVSFALIAPLQTRVVTEASQAPNLASTLNQGAFNLGNAVGAWVGGVGLTAGLAYSDLPWIGAILAIAALSLALLSLHLSRLADTSKVNRAWSVADSKQTASPRYAKALPAGKASS